MKMSRRVKCWVLISLTLLVVLVVANIQQVGQFVGGHYDWVCGDCKVGLYDCPFKHITYIEVPATYEAHQHSWRLVHRPPRWSPWKPWQWLVYLGSDRKLLTDPDPQALFSLASPQDKYSDRTGLQKLASDRQYQRADEIKRWLGEAQPRPK